MGELLKAIEGSTPLPFGKKGALQKVLETLPDDDRADLLEALNNPNIPATVISRVLHARGISLPTSAITRFRRGEAAYEPR